MQHTIVFLPLNVSVQPTDVLYASLTPGGQAGVNHPSATQDTKPIAIGEVVDSPSPPNHFGGTFWMETSGYPSVALTGQHYIFFSKDNRANMSGILGYYALVEYRNYTKNQAEMFATGTEFSPSSK